MESGRRVPRWVRVGLIAAAALTIGATGTIWALRQTAGVESLPVLAPAPRFQLTDQEGHPVSEALLTGHVTLVGFVFTTCTDICPVVTAQMRALQEELRAAGLLGRARLLSVSVDPERDSPQALAAYARQFGADTSTWRFLTGDEPHLRQVVVEGFLLGMQKVPAHKGHGGATVDGYLVEHSGRVALVDPQGRVRAYYDGQTLQAARVLHDVGQLLEGR